MVVATFTLAEDAADLSRVLRTNYQTRHIDPWIRAQGAFGGFRSKLPWARPRIYASGHATLPPDEQKRQACLDLIRFHEEAVQQVVLQPVSWPLRSLFG